MPCVGRVKCCGVPNGATRCVFGCLAVGCVMVLVLWCGVRGWRFGTFCVPSTPPLLPTHSLTAASSCPPREHTEHRTHQHPLASRQHQMHPSLGVRTVRRWVVVGVEDGHGDGGGRAGGARRRSVECDEVMICSEWHGDIELDLWDRVFAP